MSRRTDQPKGEWPQSAAAKAYWAGADDLEAQKANDEVAAMAVPEKPKKPRRIFSMSPARRKDAG